MDKSQGRTARSAAADAEAAATHSGHRGLVFEQPLLFEQGAPGRSGVDLGPVPAGGERLGGLGRKGAIGLPGLSEPQVVRHYTRL